MRTQVAFILAALAIVGCKKTPSGPGGGGGGWLVGTDAMMEQVDKNGKIAAGYGLASSEELRGIACRYAGTRARCV